MHWVALDSETFAEIPSIQKKAFHVQFLNADL